jgi:hypothetical protein
LFVGAVGHSDFAQNSFAHELWEGFAGDVDDELLFYGDSASGISLLATGDIIDGYPFR